MHKVGKDFISGLLSIGPEALFFAFLVRPGLCRSLQVKHQQTVAAILHPGLAAADGSRRSLFQLGDMAHNGWGLVYVLYRESSRSSQDQT